MSRQSSDSEYSAMPNTPSIMMATDFDLPLPTESVEEDAAFELCGTNLEMVPPLRPFSRLTPVAEVEKDVSGSPRSPAAVATTRFPQRVLCPKMPERRSCASELICRYESLSSPEAHPGRCQSVDNGRSRATSIEQGSGESRRRHSVNTGTLSHLSLIPSSKKPKKKSPIRRSFQNLIYALNKVGRRNCNPDEVPPVPPPKFTRSEATTESCGGTSDLLPQYTMPVIKTGQLWYFEADVRPQSPSWIHCSVDLFPGSIVASAPMAPERSISLFHCDDVRSVDPRRNDVAIVGTTRLQVFELSLEQNGRPFREIFGCASVQERANWISVIWHVLNATSKQLRD
jgi:hypothetical protein